MSSRFFNYFFQEAENRWDRWIFARRWLRFNLGDRRWIPPYYPDFRRSLEPGPIPHVERLFLRLFTATALPRRWGGHSEAGPEVDWPVGFRPPGALEDSIVSMSMLASDPRSPGGPASLIALLTENDNDCLERTLDRLLEATADDGRTSLIGPTGFSPYLEAGILENHWDRYPPLHTPYHPPYFAELASSLMSRVGSTRLYSLDVSAHPQTLSAKQSEVNLIPFDPMRLSGDLQPLFPAACPPPWPGCPPLDAEEATFLVNWVCRWPLTGLAALRGEQAIGFVLLQPDLAGRLRKAYGGQSLHRRAWLRWAASRPVQTGRLLFGGVLPEWRGQGVGTALLAEAVQFSRANGWCCLHIGPVPDGIPGAWFLVKHGAVPEQQYGLYGLNFPTAGI